MRIFLMASVYLPQHAILNCQSQLISFWYDGSYTMCINKVCDVTRIRSLFIVNLSRTVVEKRINSWTWPGLVPSCLQVDGCSTPLSYRGLMMASKDQKNVYSAVHSHSSLLLTAFHNIKSLPSCSHPHSTLAPAQKVPASPSPRPAPAWKISARRRSSNATATASATTTPRRTASGSAPWIWDRNSHNPTARRWRRATYAIASVDAKCVWRDRQGDLGCEKTELNSINQ